MTQSSARATFEFLYSLLCSASSTYSERSIPVTMSFPDSSEESMSGAKSTLLTAPNPESRRLRKSSLISMRPAPEGIGHAPLTLKTLDD